MKTAATDLSERISQLMASGRSVVMIGRTESGKSWFVTHTLLPYLQEKGHSVAYFAEPNDYDENVSADLVIADEVEILADRDYLQKQYPNEKPYYTPDYLIRVRDWFHKLAEIHQPTLYIVTRNTDEDIDNIVQNMKCAEWDDRPVEIVKFYKDQ